MFNITEVPTTDILITNRARTTLSDIKSLAESITRDGLLQPLVINDSNVLLAGERRLTACKSLNWDTIPCRVLPGLTKDAELMIEFVENVEREGFTWAEELELKYRMHLYWKEQEPSWGYRDTAKKLKVSLGGLSTDLTLAAAFPHFPALKEEITKTKAKDAYKKMAQQAEAITAVSNLPQHEQDNLEKMMKGETVIPTAKVHDSGPSGDAHGHEPSSVGDSTNPGERSTTDPSEPPLDSTLPAFTYRICPWKTLLAEIPAGSIGFCELDPPYAIDFNNNYGKTSNITTTENDWTKEQLTNHMENLLPALHTLLLDNSWVLCWTGKEHFLTMNNLAEKAGFSTQPPGVWVKPSGSCNSPNTNMISTYEMFLLFRKGKATFNVNSFNSVQECSPPPSSQRTHQWEKPIKLYNTFFSALGKQKSLFLSPFAGSGASMVSATLNGMTPIGCDIRQKYFFTFMKMLKSFHVNIEENET